MYVKMYHKMYIIHSYTTLYLLDYIRLQLQLHVSARFVGPSSGWSSNRWNLQL